MIKNQAGQSIGAQMVNATTGAAFAGTVTVYITIDAGTQAIGTVGSGVCQSEGNGYFSYLPSAAETNGNLIAFTFVGTGAIPATIQVATITSSQATALGSSTAVGTILVSDLLTMALKRINVVQAGQSPSAADLADALLLCNAWIDSLTLERLTIPYILRTTWTISSTKGTLASPYTVGSGADISVAKPTYLDSVRFQDTSVTPTLEYTLQPMTDAAWRNLPQKNLTSTLPSAYYYNPTWQPNVSNYGSLYLWPVPSQSNLQGVLYAPSALPQFGATTDTVILPNGYQWFIQENLAVFFASTWRDTLPADPRLVESAKLAKANIKTANVRLSDLSLDPAILHRAGGHYDINSDGVIH